MVAVAPFRALRFNRSVVGDLSAVLAPPYDVISPADQDRLYNASPFNIIRLIYGREQPTDSETSNRYTRARQALGEWRRDGVLVRDEEPAIYVCEHGFSWNGRRVRRTGWIALLQLEGSWPDQVLLHEATFDGPRADRAKLIESVRAHLSPVFAIVPDDDQELTRLLEEITAGAPEATAQAPDIGRVGTEPEELRLWTVRDPRHIARFQRSMRPASVLIADGHHRLAAAVSKRDLCPAVMTYFARRDDPGLIVRGYYRVIGFGPEAGQQWRIRLQDSCAIEPAAHHDDALRWLAAARGPGKFAVFGKGSSYQVSIKPEALTRWLNAPSVPAPLAPLDVSILHQLLLSKALGSTNGAAGQIRYTPDPAKALELVEHEPDQWAWILRPVDLREVFEIAGRKLTLPQKSTYFYPKVVSGIAINPFDD